MEADAFERTFKELEERARLDPKGYRRQVAALAALGYAYIFAVVILLLVVLALTILLLVRFPYAFLLKLVFVPIIAVFLIAKSLWVKFDSPEGIPITREDAPALFDMIATVRKATKCPAIHTVLLVSDFNCAVSQIPRLGVFGLHKNFLSLGLPLMQSMSTTQFEAVLAHEMGHLSNLHGKFGCWVYHVQMSWLQISVNLDRHSAIGTGLFKRFANWYFPKFDAYTLVLRRAHEYAADQLSGSLVGGEIAAQALINVEVKGTYLQRTFWPEQMEKDKLLPEPPTALFSLLGASVGRAMPSDEAKSLLDLASERHHFTDSHPSLAERVQALCPDRSGDAVSTLLETAVKAIPAGNSAADALLANSLPELQEKLEKSWRHDIEVKWKANYESRQEMRQQLAQLEDRAARDELSREESVERAILTANIGDKGKAIEQLRTVLEAAPEFLEARYQLGSMLLEQDDEEGLTHLEHVVDSLPGRALLSSLELCSYLNRIGRKEEAEKYLERSNHLLQEIAKASHAHATIGDKDTFKPHSLSSDRLDKLCAVLYADPRVKKAWLVDRVVPEIIGGTQTVLVLGLGSPNWFIVSQSELYKAIEELALLPEVEGFWLIPWEAVRGSLRTTCKSDSGALFYERKLWESSEASKRVIYKRPERHAIPEKSFVARNRATIIGMCLLVACIILLLLVPPTHRSMHRDAAEEAFSPPDRSEHTDVRAGVDFGSFMTVMQHDIKRHWFPPRSRQSRRVVLTFKIHRDGHVSNIKIARSSGDLFMDRAALDAVAQASPLRPLPNGAPPSVDVQFTLDYNTFNR